MKGKAQEEKLFKNNFKGNSGLFGFMSAFSMGLTTEK
jgi:hypothetical protein